MPLEIAQVVAPVRLRQNRDPQTFMLKEPAHYGMPETRVVYVGIGAHDNYVHIVPAEFVQVFFADG